MDFRLTREQEEIVARAEGVAREGLEPRAAEVDARATHPVEGWREVWKAGLLATTVPKSYGGLGLDMLTYVMVIEKLAWGCANTAMTVHMHSIVQKYIDQLGSAEQKASFYPDVVEHGRLFGSWGSEPSRRGGSGVANTILSPRDDGYVINGPKHFCTMAGGAYRYMIHCAMEGYQAEKSATMALVPRDSPGLTITGGWDTLGMRGTVSPSVTFEECPVRKECVLGKPGDSERAGLGLHFAMGYAAVFIGAAQRALDYTKEFVKKNRFDPDPAPMSHNSIIQRHVAEMGLVVESARLVMHESAYRWPEGPDPLLMLTLGSRAKNRATEAALMVTSRALQVCGGRVAHKRYPLERLFRDVRTCTLMPPNADRTLEVVGRAELGLLEGVMEERYRV
ncbi:MAG: acyl-CoA dehydrogenase [SAR202 cluster bacterium]|nr:acyl-CoA dehydrogenase [SAR202 cluster bacterium]